MKDATGILRDYVKKLGSKPLVVTDGDQPVAVLLPVDSTDLEALSLSTDPDFLDLIERSRRRQKEEGGIPLDEIRREFGIKPKDQRTPRRRTPARR